MRRVALRFASSAVAALAAIALVGGAGAQSSAGPPSGASLAALSQLPTQSSLASQRIYFVMPDRYANGLTANDTGGLSGGRARTGFDPTDTGYYHGGDLVGLASHLQRIKDLRRRQWLDRLPRATRERALRTTGAEREALVRQLLQGYYELEVGGSGETIWVPMNGVVPE